MVSRPLMLAPVVQLDPERATFTDMLDRYAISLRSRGLSTSTIEARLWGVRRFQEFTGEYPWNWGPRDVEDFTSALLSRPQPVAHSTIRGYHLMVKLFCEFLVNPTYDWHDVCLERFGLVPAQICHPWNTHSHLAEFEARASRRPFGYDELEAFFARADEMAEDLIASRGKAAIPALRDAQLFKSVYAFGLRRREAVMLDLNDLRPNPHMPDWGPYGKVHVRYGKAMKGSPPRRRTMLALPEFEWATRGLKVWVEEVRPRIATDNAAALWLSERRDRISTRTADVRFARIRDDLDLDPMLTLHSLRHSYVTHLIEFGYAERFVQEQVGHHHSSTTAIYTSVSDDWKNRVFHEALDRVLGKKEDVA